MGDAHVTSALIVDAIVLLAVFGLDTELLLSAVGVVLGLLAGWLMPVRSDTAGVARVQRRRQDLRMVVDRVKTAAITDATILQAVARVLARTTFLAVRAGRAVTVTDGTLGQLQEA